jgi:hypothetical protein
MSVVMYEIVGDLWQRHAKGSIIAITTGGLVSKKGACAMPRGCARQARDRFPDLAMQLGGLISKYGNHVHELDNRIVSFPVENSPYEVPDPVLIERSCRELVKLADLRTWQDVVVPRPGCGGGGLQWTDIRKIVVRHFDNRFTLISMES